MRTQTIEQFREKYGADAPMLEKMFEFVINENMQELETDPDRRECEYFTVSNPEWFAQFVDYTAAIGKTEMFFVMVEPTWFFYAYSVRGRENIAAYLSERAKEYERRAESLRKISVEIAGYDGEDGVLGVAV